MAFSPENLKILVNSREIHAFIQTATYSLFTKGTQLCAICVRTCNNVPLHDLTRLPRPHVPQVFVCAPCSGPLSSWRPQTTATGARGWHAFAKSWGRFWGHIGKYTSNPAAAASTSFAGRANPPPPIWSCWPRPFCGRAAKMATASANCSTAGHTVNGSAHGEP